MLIITDSPLYVTENLLPSGRLKPISTYIKTNRLKSLNDLFFPDTDLYVTTSRQKSEFFCLFVKRYSDVSQFDQLLNLCKIGDDLPEGILCFTGSSDNFHGFHYRPWIGLEGNIHLSISLNPRQKVEHAAVAFLLMAANAVTQTINGLGRLKVRAGLHWVNDIVIAGLKVGGVLCQTQMSGEKTERVIVGIGLNVRKRPAIVNDACVRGATAINEHVSDRDVYSLEEVFWPLITNLEKNYLTLLDQGYAQLLAYYIENSALIGKTIEIFSDPQQGPTKKLGEGKALEINEDLELIIEGVAAPLRKGRVRLIQHV